MEIKIKVERDFNQADQIAKSRQAIPVECSFGQHSVMDSYMLDHHGAMADAEAVSIRGYRDLFGVAANNAVFMVNHIDADNTFTIAAMAGILPHPKNIGKGNIFGKDYIQLAETIAKMDTDPIAYDVLKLPYGGILVAWESLYAFKEVSDEFALKAVDGWRQLLTEERMSSIIANAVTLEKERHEMAMKDMLEYGERSGRVLCINGNRVFGFSEWYSRLATDNNIRQASSWKNPIVIAKNAKDELIFATPNKEVAEELFGKGGLLNVFKELNILFNCEAGCGFGGREGIGGSPRGRKMSVGDMEASAVVINEILRRR